MESLGIGFKIFTSTFAGVEVAISAVMCYFFVVAGLDPSGTGESKPCYVKAGQSTPYTGPINSSAIQDYTSWAVMLCNFGAGCAGVQALITLVIMFGLCCNMKMASSCSRLFQCIAIPTFVQLVMSLVYVYSENGKVCAGEGFKGVQSAEMLQHTTKRANSTLFIIAWVRLGVSIGACVLFFCFAACCGAGLALMGFASAGSQQSTAFEGGSRRVDDDDNERASLTKELGVRN